MKALILSLLFSLPAQAATCGAGESKFVYDKATRFQDRVFFENVALCLSGSRFRVVAEELSAYNGSLLHLYTPGLCRAMGHGKTVSVDSVKLRQAEKLAYFEEDGKFSGALLTQPDVYHDYNVVGSVTCEQ